MIRLLIIGIFNLFFGEFLLGQDYPDWVTLIKLDEAPAIVVAKMHVEDSIEGNGTLSVLKVLKGKQNLREAKVQFSDKRQKRDYRKGKPMPTYWYNEGQEGIWLLMDKDTFPRYELRQPKLYYDKRWASWIKEQLVSLKNREWTISQGLAGSVIVDDVGGNKLYRFFYLCLRNDSKKILYINTHYHMGYDPDNKLFKFTTGDRYEAFIVTPDGEQFDMIKRNHRYADDICLRGGPGWAIPTQRDFVKLMPGETTYLLGDGVLRCFIRNPSKGTYLFRTSYQNDYKMEGFEGHIWTGKVTFPVTKFTYDYSWFENKK